MSEAAVQAQGKKKESIGEFIKHTRGELDKTTFPSSEDVRGTTLIVIIAVIFLPHTCFSWTTRGRIFSTA